MFNIIREFFIFVSIIPFIYISYNITYFIHNLYNYSFIYEDINIYEKENEENNLKQIQEQENKKNIKYEDKYLDVIRKLSKDWDIKEELYNYKINLNKEKMSNINKEIDRIKNEILKLDYFHFSDEDKKEEIDNKITELKKKIVSLEKEYAKIEKLNEDEHENDNEEENKKTINFIINNKLKNLENCYVIEKTPIGNVLMKYDNSNECFKYYSDYNIPYRYLEVVARKFVKIFNCRPIFIDMEEELLLFEKKWEKIQEDEKKQNVENNEKERNENNEKEIKKKSVFAKFKSNNITTSSKICFAPAPNNNLNNQIQNKENEKILLKERANRYTFEGKINNFNFLQKYDKKIFNKKLGLSFSDFKNLQN